MDMASNLSRIAKATFAFALVVVVALAALGTGGVLAFESCTEGQLKFEPTGGCCGALPKNEFERFQCIGGQWVFTGIRCFGLCL